MGNSRLRVGRRAIALLLSVATVLGVVGAAISQPANALPTLQSPNGKLLPDKPLEGPLDALNTTGKSVQETIVAIQAALAAITASVQGDGTTAHPGIIAQLQEFAAEAQADPANAATNLQAFITGTIVPPLESVALQQALALAAKIASPICPLVGAAASLQNVALPTIPDYSIFGELAPIVKRYDQNTAERVRNYYIFVMASLLSPIAIPAAAAAASPYVALAQALLSLIAVNWHTTYYPPVENPAHPPAPIVRDTPGYLFLPSLLDVDGNLGFDICANEGLDLTTLKMNEQIDRIPTSDPNMRLDIEGQALLGVFRSGYQIPAGSNIPAMFDSNFAGSTGVPIQTKTHVVGKSLTQYHSLAGALAYTVETKDTPTIYTVTQGKPGGTSGNGTQTNWVASDDAKSFAYYVKVGSLLLNEAGAQNPAPDHFEYCVSAKGFCSNAPAADTAVETQSMHVIAQKATDVNIFNSAAGQIATTCPSTAILGDAHFRAQRFFMGTKSSSDATTEGHTWVDTDDLPATGCIAAASTTGTLPPGFKAQNRRAAFKGGGTSPAVTTKSGTIVCPAAIPAAPPAPAVPGTSLTGGSLGISFGLSRYLCPAPPVNTVAPTITGQNYQASQLTANKGTWTPGAPNTPVFTYQWMRCDAAGASCAPIGGETATTYTNTPTDLGHTIRVVVTGTNPDGSASATSAPTDVVKLPPAPFNTFLPVISGVVGTGNELTGSQGTWINAPTSFAYQWQLCDASGVSCADISGANTNKYTPSLSDQGHQLKVAVTASNIGGTNTATSDGVYVPPPPTNTVAPFVKNGSSDATGMNVNEADHLVAANGTWTDAASFGYQWQSCAADLSDCQPIAGATHQNYTVSHDDIGRVLKVTVTATNPDGSLSVDTAATDIVLANALLPKTPGAVPDGQTFAATDSGHNSALVGGSFDTVGPNIGGGGAVPGTGATTAAASKAATLGAKVKGGVVNATVSDTLGGYFLGGSFTEVLGLPCLAIAHVKNDGSLDASYCQAPGFTGEVRALTYAKRNVTIGVSSPIDVLSVGGLFTRSDAHANFMFLDNLGTPTFLPGGDPDGAVNAIADDTSASRANYFVGGAFGQAGGVAMKRLTMTSISSPPTAGTPMTLSISNYPGSVNCVSCASPVVNTILFVLTSNVVSWPNVVVGGVFDSVTTTGTTPVTATRNNLFSFAEMSAGTQTLGAWNPNPNGAVKALAAGTPSGGNTGGTPIYIAGDFTSLTNGVTTTSGFTGLAEYGLQSQANCFCTTDFTSRASTGTADKAYASPNATWKPVIDNGKVLSIVSESSAGGVFVGGSFTSIGGVVRHRLASLSTPALAGPTLNVWDPNAGQTVRAIARYVPGSGTPSLFAGGDFLVLGGETRLNVADIKPDGTLGTWVPAGTDGPVKAIAQQGGVVYLGGTFTNKLRALDGTTGAVVPWGTADGAVNVLTAAAGGIYVGGAFANAGGAPRSNVALLDTSGNATGWNPGASGPVKAIFVNADGAYVGGSFSTAGGASRDNIALIDGSGFATSWAPNADGPVNTITVNAAGAYVGGSFANIGGAARSNLALIDTSVGLADGSYLPNPDGVVNAIRLVGIKLIVGGAFANIGGLPRLNAAQVDFDGTATGFLSDPNAPVLAVMGNATGLVGLFGNFTVAGGMPTNGYAFYGG